jgi:hypothetical protein
MPRPGCQGQPALAWAQVEIGHKDINRLRWVAEDGKGLLGIPRFKEVDADRFEKLGDGKTHHRIVLN